MDKETEIKQISVKKQKPRLDYLDYAKCISIFLVVLGHTTGNLDTPFYRVSFHTFHMPLFFMVSGMVISRHRHEYNKEHWKNFLYKNVMALLVPYLIWGAIYSNFTYSNFAKLFYASWEMLNNAETLTSLWYLPCLFVARVMAEFILMISWEAADIPRHVFAFLVSTLSFSIGFALPEIEIGYPLCLNVAFVALGFILLGYSLKEFIFNLPKNRPWVYLISLFIFGGLLTFGLLVQGDEPHLMTMCNGNYGNLLLFFLNAFAGIGMVFSLSIFLSIIFKDSGDNKVKKFMLWTGKNTIGIYLLHKPFLQQVVMAAIAALGAQLPNLGWALLGTVIAFSYSCAACWVINKYVPSLFGRFPKLVAKSAEKTEK